MTILALSGLPGARRPSSPALGKSPPGGAGRSWLVAGSGHGSADLLDDASEIVEGFPRALPGWIRGQAQGGLQAEFHLRQADDDRVNFCRRDRRAPR
jgi:hypothetical protein